MTPSEINTSNQFDPSSVKLPASPTSPRGMSFIEEDRSLLNPWIQGAKDLVLWKSVEKSGVALGVSLITLIFFTTLGPELYRFIGAILCVSTLLNLLYVGGIRVMQAITAPSSTNLSVAPHPYVNLLSRTRFLRISESTFRYWATLLLTFTSMVVRNGARIVLVADLTKTVKALFGFYVFWSLAACIQVSILTGLMLIGCFTIPVTYDRNKVLIEKQKSILSELVKDKLGFLLERTRTIRNEISKKFESASSNGPKKEE